MPKGNSHYTCKPTDKTYIGKVVPILTKGDTFSQIISIPNKDNHSNYKPADKPV